MEILMKMLINELELFINSAIKFCIMLGILSALLRIWIKNPKDEDIENNSNIQHALDIEPKKTEKSEFVKKEIIREKNIRKRDIGE